MQSFDLAKMRKKLKIDENSGLITNIKESESEYRQDTLTSKFYISTISAPTDTHPIHFSDDLFIPPIKNKRGLVYNPKCNIVFGPIHSIAYHVFHHNIVG